MHGHFRLPKFNLENETRHAGGTNYIWCRLRIQVLAPRSATSEARSGQVALQGKSVAQEGKSVAQEGKPVAQEGKSVGQDGSMNRLAGFLSECLRAVTAFRRQFDFFFFALLSVRCQWHFAPEGGNTSFYLWIAAEIACNCLRAVGKRLPKPIMLQNNFQR